MVSKNKKNLGIYSSFTAERKNSGVRHLIPVHNRHMWFLTPYRQSKCRSEQVTHYGSHSQKNKSPTLLPTPLAPSASGIPLLHVYINTIYVKLCSGSSIEGTIPPFFPSCVASGLYGVFHYTWYNTNTSRIHSSIFALHNAFKLIFE